jgi:UDP-4-amino-4,6-dideoxy-N-acetyl-beta-L-altrosamine transaminase
MIPYGRQQITQEDIEAVVETLKGDFLTQGPAVAKFEKDFSQFIGAQHCIAVNNATAALHLACLALGVRTGTKVLCTPNTFVASSNAVLYCGGEVEFVDIDPNTYCIDLNKLEAKLASSSKGSYQGLVAVDFAGYPMDLEKIRNIIKPYGLWLIEDACHAPGAEFKNSQGQWIKSGSGQYADIATFSFHPVKHIATGEGGMITTNSEELAQKIRLLRTHGITKDPKEMSKFDGGWDMEMQALGFNYRMPDLLCALGSSQLKRIESNLKRRREIALRYDQELKALPIKTPANSSLVQHAYHLYVIRTSQRKELYDFLKTRGVYSQVHYVPIYQQPYYRFRYGRQKFAEMDHYYQEALSLPMYHGMTSSEQEKVISAIQAFFKAQNPS